MVVVSSRSSSGKVPAVTSSRWGCAENRSVDALLRLRAKTHSNWEYCRWRGGSITFADLDRRVGALAQGLFDRGVVRGDHIALMMGHHVDHIVAIFALARIGAVNVPINPRQKGDSLKFLLSDSEPKLYIIDTEFSGQLLDAIGEHARSLLVERGGHSTPQAMRFETLCNKSESDLLTEEGYPSDVATLLYTSGTTGLPKGVPMSDTMLRASAIGSLELSAVEEGSVLHFWDPLYHVFGIETLILAVIAPAHLALVPAFSASRFWDECREFGVTHIHYVGSILPILLKQPEFSDDRDHAVRFAWGGGCPDSVWRAFETRFGVTIREGYGLTETSSFCLVNTTGPKGSVGKPLAYFDAAVLDLNGEAQEDSVEGEIAIHAEQDGVLFPGYYNRPDATSAAFRNGWFLTGDIGYCDGGGNFYFVGRRKNIIRRKGENISATAIENIVSKHPDIEECAVIPVPSDVGEDELKLFVLPVPQADCPPSKISRWCHEQMADFMVPRFIVTVDQFDKTPTHRVRKETLSTDTSGCWKEV